MGELGPSDSEAVALARVQVARERSSTFIREFS